MVPAHSFAIRYKRKKASQTNSRSCIPGGPQVICRALAYINHDAWVCQGDDLVHQDFLWTVLLFTQGADADQLVCGQVLAVLGIGDCAGVGLR